MVNELPIEKPEDYTPDEAQSIEQELAATYDSTYGSSEQRAAAVAQFNEIKPTIVAVMNESFSDLSCFEQLQAAGYTGPRILQLASRHTCSRHHARFGRRWRNGELRIRIFDRSDNGLCRIRQNPLSAISDEWRQQPGKGP